MSFGMIAGEWVFVIFFLAGAATFVAYSREDNERAVYGIKGGWYLMTVIYAIFNVISDDRTIENVYAVLLFLVLFIEMLDNFMLMGSNPKNKND